MPDYDVGSGINKLDITIRTYTIESQVENIYLGALIKLVNPAC